LHTISTYHPSLVTKASIEKIPVIGTLAKSGHCIFVKRESEDDRKNAIDAINKRAINIQKGQKYPPIGLFVEGTVSNGRYLL